MNPLKRLLRLLQRRNGDRLILDEEIEAHLRFLEEQFREEGLSARDARTAARRQFGNLSYVREETRNALTFGLIESTLRDLRYALRGLSRSPGLVVVAALSLGLGIGVNLALYSAVRVAFFEAPTAAQPDSLVRLRLDGDSHSTYPILQALSDSEAVFDLAGYADRKLIWSNGQASREANARVVTPNFFDTVGGNVAEGRLFARAETPVSNPSGVVVVSHRFWQQALASEPAALAHSFLIEGKPHAVIGVLPEEYRPLDGIGSNPDFYIPASTVLFPNLLDARDGVRMVMIGRLPDGQTKEQARQAVLAIGDALRERFDPGNDRFAQDCLVARLSGLDKLTSSGDSRLLIFAGALVFLSVLVLFVACANVAGILMARAIGRRREIAIRLAIGASQRQIAMQLLTEGAALSLLGAAVGLALCYGSFQFLVEFGTSLTVPIRPSFDPSIAITALALGVFSTLLSTLLPAARSGRQHLTAALRNEEPRLGSSPLTARTALVIGQIAVCVLLLICTAISYRGLKRAEIINPGFDLDRTLTVRLREPQTQLAVSQGLDLLRTMPGLESIAAAERIPLTFSGQSTEVRIQGGDEAGPFPVKMSDVTPDYFRTLDIPVVAGRELLPQDGRDNVLVNQLFARRRFPDGNAVGRRVLYGPPDSSRALEIVGIVGDTKYFSLGEQPEEILYRPLSSAQSTLHLFARTRGDADTTAAVLHKQLQGALPSALVEVKTLSSNAHDTLIYSRIGSTLLALLGSLALGLALIGFYGALSYAVSLRTSEYGIRVALGARRSAIVALVIRQSFYLIAVGGVLGAVCAVLVTRQLSALIIGGISAYDPVSIGGALTAVAAVGVCTALIPAARVLRLDPLDSLRSD